MIKAIAFDIGGVMNGVEVEAKEFYSLLADKFNITYEEWTQKVYPIFNRALTGKITKEEALNKMAKNLNSHPDKVEELFIEAYNKMFVRNNELYDYAYNLKKSEYKLIILSDQWPVSNEAIIKIEDRKKFDWAIISCEVGTRKPEKEMFDITIKKTGLSPNEIVFIDDREENIEAAKKVGMNGIVFRNNKQVMEDLKNLGVEVK
jgi:putative hydrolase of the HAD superfamily